MNLSSGLRLLLGAGALIVIAGCGQAAPAQTAAVQGSTASPSPSGTQLTVEIKDAQGTTVAVATLTPASTTSTSPSTSGSPSSSGAATSGSPSGSASMAPGGVTSSPGSTVTGVHFHIEVRNLPPGSHGFAIRAKGVCDPPDFRSSGPHFNPTNKRHGFLNKTGPHAGDLPNLPVGSDGQATLDFVDSDVTLDQSSANSLLHGDGTSLVVTRNPDDEISQPDGNSGQPIACGVIASGSASPSASASGSSSGSGGSSTMSPSASASASPGGGSSPTP